MNLSDFDYEYPKAQVAQRPLPERDASRMMVVDRATRACRHSRIAALPDELRRGDLLVFNDSRVVPARLFGKRCTGESVEVLLVEPVERTGSGERGAGNRGHGSRIVWRCLLKKAKRIRAGEQFFFGMQATATACGRDGIFLLLEFTPKALALAIEHHGVPPLPPYIERAGYDAYTREDRQRYQTVFARAPGSAAAPTAGLHISEPLLARLRGAGIATAAITLHVGIDTFAPLRTDDARSHRMHGERYEILPAAAATVAAAKDEGRRIVAVGTTTARALESAAIRGQGAETGRAPIAPGSGVTDLFIMPGYEFRIVDAMLTNFHQPKSTLLMLVSAFATPPGAAPLSGRDFIFSCYADAIREGYRLFSYGDCMLIV